MMTSLRPHILPLTLLFVLLNGCGSAAKRTVELRSEPAGSEVRTAEGEIPGVTPLKIEEVQLNKISKKAVFSVEISHPGYVQDHLILDAHGDDEHEVKMQKLDESYFSRKLINDFSKQANAMARDLLRIQKQLPQRTGALHSTAM